MIIELLLMSKDELYFGVCRFKDTETCTACHCRWFYFCAASVVIFAGFLLLAFTPLLTCYFKAQTLWNIIRAATASAVGNAHQFSWPRRTAGRGDFSLSVALAPTAAGSRGSAEDWLPAGHSNPGVRLNCRAVFSTWRWYFRPVLLQLSRVDK